MASCITCSDLRANFPSDWIPLISTLTSSWQAALLPYSDELSLYYHRRLARPGLHGRLVCFHHLKEAECPGLSTAAEQFPT